MSTFRRFARLLSAIVRPWAVSLALLGAAVTAFPPWLGQSKPHVPPQPAGPTVEVTAVYWPHPRVIGFGWAFREWPRRYLGWREHSERFGVGKAEIGFDRSASLPHVRPPGASADYVAYYVTLWWLLGPPAVLSVVAGWRALREEPERSPAASRPSIAWPLARPWVATFAVVGVGLLASGLEAPNPAGPNRTVLEVSVLRTPLEAWNPREVFVVANQIGPGAPLGGRLSAKAFSVGLWWLVAVPAACNFVTLVRLVRRRGTGRSV